MMEKSMPFSCPVCARVTDYPIHILVEDAMLSCAFCKVKLRLHGHMLEYVQKEISKMKRGDPVGGEDRRNRNL
jgi:hypothetical protein